MYLTSAREKRNVKEGHPAASRPTRVLGVLVADAGVTNGRNTLGAFTALGVS
jgi:hypothetical protein